MTFLTVVSWIVFGLIAGFVVSVLLDHFTSWGDKQNNFILPFAITSAVIAAFMSNAESFAVAFIIIGISTAGGWGAFKWLRPAQTT